MPKAMRHLQETLGIEKHPVIAYNGGLILTYDQEEPQVLWSQPIDIHALQIIHQYTRTSPVHVSLYTFDDWYVQELDQWALREINNTKVEPTVANFDDIIPGWEQQGISPHKIMCMGPEADILHVYRSKSTYLELASKSISKASAIRHLLQEKWGYTPAAAVAFGDNYNDIDMLKTVGRGIAVANANDALQQVAHEITSSNLEDGVAVAIEKYFL
jgi:Cof subfamily protein (haloacid dehalogenase superfamily)